MLFIRKIKLNPISKLQLSIRNTFEQYETPSIFFNLIQYFLTKPGLSLYLIRVVIQNKINIKYKTTVLYDDMNLISIDMSL